MTARFALKVDDDNGHHVRFRLYAATDGQHPASVGVMTMRVDEYEVFRRLLEPALTDRAEAPEPSKFKPGWLQAQVERSVASLNQLPDGLRQTIRGEGSR